MRLTISSGHNFKQITNLTYTPSQEYVVSLLINMAKRILSDLSPIICAKSSVYLSFSDFFIGIVHIYVLFAILCIETISTK